MGITLRKVRSFQVYSVKKLAQGECAAAVQRWLGLLRWLLFYFILGQVFSGIKDIVAVGAACAAARGQELFFLDFEQGLAVWATGLQEYGFRSQV